jgi:hypothetical protein
MRPIADAERMSREPASDGYGSSRRPLRAAGRAVQRLLGIQESTVEPTELVDELHHWVLGLPYVMELEPVPSAPDLRRFAIDCEPLRRSAVWLLTGAFDPEVAERDVNVYAVLPQSVAQALVGAGGKLGPDLADDRRFVAMGAPSRPSDLVGLEDVLLMAYSFAFSS